MPWLLTYFDVAPWIAFELGVHPPNPLRADPAAFLRGGSGGSHGFLGWGEDRLYPPGAVPGIGQYMIAAYFPVAVAAADFAAIDDAPLLPDALTAGGVPGTAVGRVWQVIDIEQTLDPGRSRLVLTEYVNPRFDVEAVLGADPDPVELAELGAHRPADGGPALLVPGALDDRAERWWREQGWDGSLEFVPAREPDWREAWARLRERLDSADHRRRVEAERDRWARSTPTHRLRILSYLVRALAARGVFHAPAIELDPGAAEVTVSIERWLLQVPPAALASLDDAAAALVTWAQSLAAWTLVLRLRAGNSPADGDWLAPLRAVLNTAETEVYQFAARNALRPGERRYADAAMLRAAAARAAARPGPVEERVFGLLAELFPDATGGERRWPEVASWPALESWDQVTGLGTGAVAILVPTGDGEHPFAVYGADDLYVDVHYVDFPPPGGAARVGPDRPTAADPAAFRLMLVDARGRVVPPRPLIREPGSSEQPTTDEPGSALEPGSSLERSSILDRGSPAERRSTSEPAPAEEPGAAVEPGRLLGGNLVWSSSRVREGAAAYTYQELLGLARSAGPDGRSLLLRSDDAELDARFEAEAALAGAEVAGEVLVHAEGRGGAVYHNGRQVPAVVLAEVVHHLFPDVTRVTLLICEAGRGSVPPQIGQALAAQGRAVLVRASTDPVAVSATTGTAVAVRVDFTADGVPAPASLGDFREWNVPGRPSPTDSRPVGSTVPAQPDTPVDADPGPFRVRLAPPIVHRVDGRGRGWGPWVRRLFGGQPAPADRRAGRADPPGAVDSGSVRAGADRARAGRGGRAGGGDGHARGAAVADAAGAVAGRPGADRWRIRGRRLVGPDAARPGAGGCRVGRAVAAGRRPDPGAGSARQPGRGGHRADGADASGGAGDRHTGRGRPRALRPPPAGGVGGAGQVGTGASRRR